MFVALGIQRVMFMYYIVICSLPGSVIFSSFSHKRHDYRKKVIEHKMCVVIVSTMFVRNIFRSKMNAGDYIIDVRRSTCKVTVILVIF